MKISEPNNLRDKMFFTYKRMWFFSCLGTALGAGIGAYLSEVYNNYAYLIFGIFLGYLMGFVFGLILGKKVILFVDFFTKIETKFNLWLVIMSMFLAIVGLLMYLMDKLFVGIAALLFFGIGAYFLWRNR